MGDLLASDLVARQPEWTALCRALDAASAGRGATIVLSGEAGVGKTRLLREVRARCAAKGVAVLSGRAAQSATPLPFRPLIEALLDADRIASLRDEPEVAPFRAALGRLVPAWPREPVADSAPPDLLHVAEGFLRVARSRGGVVLLDDLQWADPETIEVLEYLADHVAQEPVLVVATTRADRQHPGHAGLVALADRRSARMIPLKRLSPDQTTDMVRACLRDAAAPPPLLRLVQDRADGLPFFVEELLADLASDGALTREDDGWVLHDGGHVGVPVTVAESVRRRFSSLQPAARTVLLDAALLGRRIDHGLLGVLGDDHGAIGPALRAATELALVEAVGGAMQFRHALTRDALLATIGADEQRARSRQLLAAVRAARPELDGDLAEVAAELAEKAGESGVAAALLREIARRALGQGALSSAEAAQRRALGLVAGGDVGLELELSCELVNMLALAGRADEAFPLGEVLLARLAEPGMDPVAAQRTAVHLDLARAAVAVTDWALAAAHLDHVPNGADAASQARVATLWAVVRLGEYRVADAERLSTAAVDAAERTGEPDLLTEALLVRGRCARVRDLAAAEGPFERARGIARDAGLKHREARAVIELGVVRGYVGSGWREPLEDARRLAAECGAPETEAIAEHCLAACGWWRDDPSALAHATTAGRLAQRFRLGQLVPAAMMMAAACHALRADRAAMEALLAEAVQRSDGGVTEEIALHAHCRGACALAEGDLEGAVRELRIAADLALEAPHAELPPLVALELLARAAAGDDGVGEDRLVAWRNRVVGLGSQMEALIDVADAVHLGRIGDAAAGGLVDGALNTLSDAWFVRAVVGWLAGIAARSGGWGDPVRWTTDAHAAFAARKLSGPAQRCRQALRDLDPAQAGTGGSLTPREREVLELVSLGMPNRAIAAQLFLSPRTVEKYVERLLAKTGSANRTQLAGLSAREHVPGTDG